MIVELFFLYWPYQRSFILKIILRCVRKLSVGRIQNGHTYFIPLHVFGRSWQGYRLGVHFFAWIDFFDWSKISSKFFVQAFFCWLLTCVYCIYLISVHWYWNLSSGVIANYLWAISKPDIHILFLCMFVEGRGRGSGWLFRLVFFNWLIYIQFLTKCAKINPVRYYEK